MIKSLQVSIENIYIQPCCSEVFMNEIISKIIRQRRSIRKFTAQMPGEQEIEQILEAARWAPSGQNNQPWKFMVIRDTITREGLAQFTSYKRIVRGAPISIVVCLDTAISYNRDKDLMAVGAAIQNMLLCIHSLGLGACWLGEIINRKEKVSQYLDLAGEFEIMAVVAIGYPAENPAEVARKPLKELLIERKEI
jgi:nitroreductase